VSGELTTKRRGSSLAGRPPKNFLAWRNRERERLGLRAIRSVKKAMTFLETHEIDALWVRVFAEVTDRVGLPRRQEQASSIDARVGTYNYPTERR